MSTFIKYWADFDFALAAHTSLLLSRVLSIAAFVLTASFIAAFMITTQLANFRLFARTGICALLPLLFFCELSLAQESKPASSTTTAQQAYKAVGGPTVAKVPVFWNRYHDGQEITKILHDLATAFPELCKVQSLGKSFEGRDIWVATITNFKVGDEPRKPGFWIDAGIHANEIQANEVALYTAWFLAEMHAENQFVQELLRDRVLYILPSLSPDSREAHFYRANSTNSPRSGQRPIDDDRDCVINEDPANDLKCASHITQTLTNGQALLITSLCLVPVEVCLGYYT